MESVNLIPHPSGRRYGTDTSRQRQDHARRPSSDTAIEGFDHKSSPCRYDLKPESNGDEVEKASLCPPRCRDGTEGTAFDGVEAPRRKPSAVAFRKHTSLPLDDCLYALQPTIPHLTRSSLHRLFQRHSISRLPADRRRRQAAKGVQAPTQSATSTSTSPKCAPEKANSICSLLSIELRSLRSPQLHEQANRNTATAIPEGLDRGCPLHDPHGSHR